jgi:hypothetical protein
MDWLKKLQHIILWPLRKIMDEVRLRKKLKELKKRDPFIYK